ncbi:MAG: sulfite exporter TauE/SafE family protein [Synechococcaceae cyanobacterium]|nr:sulfite exporter TauE/SafE family protein [Synechococcaceae cyanobacterium]
MSSPAALAPALEWLALGGFLAGLINAVAGGGSLLSFPMLLATGLPAIVANTTNAVALVPGYVGAALAQRPQLRGQHRRLWRLVPAAALGGLLGAVLLLRSQESLFTRLVPWLILSGALLLGLQGPLKRSLGRWAHRRGRPLGERWVALPVFLASIYGGYFGAGLGVILLALLAISLEDTLLRLHGVKQVLALVSNLAAALLFVVCMPVAWPQALVMALAAVAGGAVGGRLIRWLDAGLLRALVVAVATLVALVLLLRG